MAESVLVFISHSSEDKEGLVEPIAEDLERCYIRTWVDTKRIAPGDNLRKSILKDGLEKADIVLIFFTQSSLRSSWVDREIKHVLSNEMKKDNNFDLSKVISIFDSHDTYKELRERYPELTDELLHLMPSDYGKMQLAQLVSAIWSKHLSLRSIDLEVQKELLAKDREIFDKDQEITFLKNQLGNKGYREERMNRALEVITQLSHYIDNWRRLRTIARLASSRSLDESEQSRMKRYIDNRDVAREQLIANINIMPFFFEEEVTTEFQSFKQWDTQQSSKRLEELPEIEDWDKWLRDLSSLLRRNI